MKTTLRKEIIRPFTVLNESAKAEEDYGFMTRTDFVNLTGIFVSPVSFWTIADDYNYQNDLSPVKFAEKWKVDNEAIFETIKLDGEITCLIDDDDITALGSDHDILSDRTAIDIINDLLVDGWEQRQKRDELYAVIDKMNNLINNSKKNKKIEDK